MYIHIIRVFIYSFIHVIHLFGIHLILTHQLLIGHINYTVIWCVLGLRIVCQLHIITVLDMFIFINDYVIIIYLLNILKLINLRKFRIIWLLQICLGFRIFFFSVETCPILFKRIYIAKGIEN